MSEYEPGCIEAISSESGSAVPVSELLARASYSNQWMPHLNGSRLEDAAICVFAPNRAEHPEDCSLEYLGAFSFRVVYSEWFERLACGEFLGAELDIAPDRQDI